MNDLHQMLAKLDEGRLGHQAYALVESLYPLCRSITGEGVRRTLEQIGARLPLEIREVPTGTQVLDWTVPKEWNIRQAWIKDPFGKTVVDFADHNLHVLNYSVPVHRKLSLEELRPHLYSDPERPEVIPYRTSYFEERWGFCLPHRQLESLSDGEYEVMIDSSLEPGSLTYGESLLHGSSPAIIHLSAHCCHPSLANDNLSGLAVVAMIGSLLHQLVEAGGTLRYSYNLLFAPGTIGAITWLARNRATASVIEHGLVAANLGDGGQFVYKRSRQGETVLDRAVERVLVDAGEPHAIEDFVPFGYDERQYCSPGFDLAIGSLTRTPWGRYPEYHCSADNLDLVRPEHLGRSLRRYLEVLALLESNRRYRNLEPYGEPQLGRRGLYNSLGGRDDGRERELALLWVLNLSDGGHDLLDICRRSGLPFSRVAEAVEALRQARLLEPTGTD